MKNQTLVAFAFCAILLGCGGPASDQNAETAEKTAKSANRTTGSIERLSPELDKLIPVNAQIEIIGEGFDWTEGPLWLESQQALVFSDIPPNSIFKWTEADRVVLFLKPSGHTGEVDRQGEPGSNGLLLNPEGKLVLCQHGDRRIALMDAPLDAPAPQFTTIVAEFNGKRFNSPNDATYSKAGDLFFTDPPYGLEKGMKDPAKELDFQGVYRYSAAGELSLLTKEMSRPNGIALSPDETKLYVANSDPDRAIWMEFPLREDGSIGEGKIFYDATEKVGSEKGLPDGMKVDNDGNLYATGPGGVWIFAPDGAHLGTIKTGQATSNCAFNTSKDVLFITADMYLLRVKLR